MRSTLVALGVTAVLVVGGAPTASGAGANGAQTWQLDPSFGTGGIVSTDFPGDGHRYAWGYDSAVQPNGRTVVVGVATGDRDDAAIARYLPDGSLDPSFGDGGRVTVGPHALYRPATVAFQSVGGQDKILVAVATTFTHPYRYRCSVLRLNPDGSLDSDHDADPGVVFGTEGVKVVSFAHNSGFCEGMAVDANGKIVVTVESSADGGDVAAFRLLGSDGALDPGFGQGGRVTLAAPGYQVPGPVAIQPGPTGAPRVLIGGLVSRQHGYDWALWRLRSNGDLDPTFGHGGRTVTTMYDDRVQQSFESVSGLAVEDDGAIVASGDYRSWPAGKSLPQDVAAVTEYSSDGILDRGFGVNGRAQIPFDDRGDTAAEDVTVDDQGRILFSGALAMPTSGMFLVGGFAADGTPDTRFGASGYLEFSVGGGPYTDAASLSLDPAGRIVLAGIWGDPVRDADRFAVVRLRLHPKG